MDVIYAAEKRSIAELLGDYVNQAVDPDEIDVTENPGETGSFYIGWRLRRYRLSPGGEIMAAVAERQSRHASQATTGL
jgi:hypothetical protein